MKLDLQDFLDTLRYLKMPKSFSYLHEILVFDISIAEELALKF